LAALPARSVRQAVYNIRFAIADFVTDLRARSRPPWRATYSAI